MNSVRITKTQLKTLTEYLLQSKNESAVFLIAGYFRNSLGSHLVVRDIILPKNQDYDDRTEFHIQMSPVYFNKVISIAEANELTVIQCHSHPFPEKGLRYSPTDNFGEATSAKTIHECLNGKPMGSLLFGKNEVIGRIWLDNKNSPIDIEELRLVDRHLQIQKLVETKNSDKTIDKDLYDRQIQAFGIRGQKILSQLIVGVVGLGGTGSSIAEQLAREGIKNFILVDQDKFEISNLTRVYGSSIKDRGKNKVEIAEQNIKQICSDSVVQKIFANVISQKTLSDLKDCDVIFSCTDRHAPRSVLNELAYQYSIPTIDVGVGLDSNNEKILGGTVRATLLSPTLPCLYCTGILNSELILAESLSKEELESRKDEGYIQGLTDDVPSVIILTTLAASFGLLLMKDILFKVFDSKSSTVTLDISTFETSRLAASVQNDCVCKLRTAKGDYIPLSAP
ncbi:MAG: putative JAB domain-containing protein [Nitrosopumilales archaeon]|nr:MAG: putative JAB domain-containing protein [Nitrosopumilales archaeon]